MVLDIAIGPLHTHTHAHTRKHMLIKLKDFQVALVKVLYFILFFSLKKIDVQLIYNVVLVSGVQQSDIPFGNHKFVCYVCESISVF